MKHLFFIHSHITFIISSKIIKYLNLDSNDCVFLIHRSKIEDYKVIGVKMILFPKYFYESQYFDVHKKFWHNWRKLSVLDDFINCITENKIFTFYTPQTNQNFLSLIISHQRCSSYNIIEEGSGSYLNLKQLKEVHPKVDFSYFFRLLWILNFKNRIKINRSFIEAKYKYAFGLSAASFPDLDRKIILGLPTASDFVLVNVINNKTDEYKNILVFDALVEICWLDSGTLLLSTLYLINKLKNNGETVLHVKFHPAQYNNSVTVTLLTNLFKQIDGFEVLEIPSGVSLEELAFKNENLAFYIFVSSVGIYASLYGRTVYSLFEFAESLYPSLSKKKELLPYILKEKVKSL